MRLGIDCDGCVASFCDKFTELACNLGIVERAWQTGEQKKWDFDFYTEPVWKEWKNTYNIWMTLYPLISEREIHVLNQIIDKHDVYFLTARSRTLGFSAELQTRLW